MLKYLVRCLVNILAHKQTNRANYTAYTKHAEHTEFTECAECILGSYGSTVCRNGIVRLCSAIGVTAFSAPFQALANSSTSQFTKSNEGKTTNEEKNKTKTKRKKPTAKYLKQLLAAIIIMSNTIMHRR